MKSVIQEASSIAKAIEQGWLKAGKPKDFSVKVFEEPEKNFFGFTTKPAKIGIFIERHSGGDDRHRQKGPAHKRPFRRSHPRRTDGRDDQRQRQPRGLFAYQQPNNPSDKPDKKD